MSGISIERILFGGLVLGIGGLMLRGRFFSGGQIRNVTYLAGKERINYNVKSMSPSQINRLAHERYNSNLPQYDPTKRLIDFEIMHIQPESQSKVVSLPESCLSASKGSSQRSGGLLS
ncbi:MAG: hypothetical protein ACHQUC_08560 [Chlamydiales bacterium]